MKELRLNSFLERRNNMKIGVIGGGAWGATLAQVIIDNGHEAKIYDINKNLINKINIEHRHPFFEVDLPLSLQGTTSLEEVISFQEMILLAVPTKFMRTVLKEINSLLTHETVFIDVSKGLEPESYKRMSDLVKDEIDLKYLKGYVVLTGPSHAEEVIIRQLTLLTAASENIELAKKVQEIFSNDTYMRVYTSTDVIGCEVGGAAKNAIAVVSGMLTGSGMGENARAALITRGILEIARVVEFYGGNKETVFGLTGIGDLIVTASSENSRNFRAGVKLGKKMTLEAIYADEPQTIEGIRSIEALNFLAQKEDISLPIIQTAYEVIFNNMNQEQALSSILKRQLKKEEIK